MTGRRVARASGRSNKYRGGRGGKPFNTAATPIGLLPSTACECGHLNCEHFKVSRNGGRPCRYINTREMKRCGCSAFKEFKDKDVR